MANTKTTRPSVFQYEGINNYGEKCKGEIEARSVTMAKAELRKKGIVTRKVQKKRSALFDPGNKKISQGDITVFSRQLAIMIKSGIPLMQSFDIVAKGEANKRMQKLIGKVKAGVEIGLTLSEALKRHPKYFGDLFCNLVDAGERSGSLDIMLDKVAAYKEKIETIKKKVKKTLTYPIAVMVIALLVTAGLMMFVVPQFESLFKGFGADLPALTRTVISMSEFFQAYWYVISVIGFAAVWGFVRSLKHSKPFAEKVDASLLKFPIIGPIIEKAATARFARTLSITFAAGLPLVDALRSVSGETGNILYAKGTENICAEVAAGTSMHLAMEHTNLFQNMVIQMVAIGEETGSLETMLSRVADLYEEEVDNAVEALSSLLEPIIMSVLGILVGGMVVAMYLPIFKLGSAI